MKVVGLISGGKDSCYNLMQCLSEGHELVALGNLKPADKDELDSYMYQTVGHHAIDLYAEAMGLPLFRRVIQGGSLQQGRVYNTTEDDEVEDLMALLTQIKSSVPFDAVSVGAILSDYQRVRVEHVCTRLGMTCLAYLWRRDQSELLKEMIDSGVKAVVIKVAALGLTPEKHLGLTLQEIYPHMLLMKEKYGLNPCGEGGEYETFTLDCPLFKKRIVIESSDTVVHSADAFAPVAYLNFTSMHLEDKVDTLPVKERLKLLPMKRSCDILDDIGCHDSSKKVTVTTKKTVQSDSCVQCTLNRALWHYEYLNQPWTAVTGIVGLVDDGETVEQQTKVAMETMTESLQKCHLQTLDVVAVCLYVSNLADFTKINAVYKTYFGQNPPIRVCVEAMLPVGVVLQLDCLAHSCQSSMVTMHVQGVSHWAPANIGPYSQAVKVGSKIYVAGQIALVPGTMCMVEGGIVAQTRLSLRHIQRVLQAVSPGSGHLRRVRLALCYITDLSYVDVGKEEWQRSRKEEQETDWEESGQTQEEGDTLETLCEYVVVPRLPRDALIEWQVYVSGENGTTVQEFRSEIHSEGYTASCVCQKVTSDSGGQYCVSFKACVASKIQPDSTDARTALHLCLKVLHASLTKLQSHVTAETDHVTAQSDHVTDHVTAQSDHVTAQLDHVIGHVTSLRIFYTSQYFKDGVIFTEYPSVWREMFGEQEVIPPAFVPVKTMDGVGKILSICH